MTEKNGGSDWVYVYVGGKEGSENFLGLYSEDLQVDFIPAFATKEAAQTCYLTLPRAKGSKYEVQAVLIEELRRDAEANGFIVTMLDEDGKICAGDDDTAAGEKH